MLLYRLSYEQRYTNELLFQADEPKSVIATEFGIDKSIVYLEVKRNCDGRNIVYKSN